MASRYLGYLLVLLSIYITLPCYALEPVPRQWSHLPMDTNFISFGYAHINADIFVDPTLALENVEMQKDTLIGKYIRTFELFDRSARIDITQPYTEGIWRGLLNGVPAKASRKGLSDTFVRLAMNLYGAPPLKGEHYARFRSTMNIETIIGLGLSVRLPTGEYKEDKLINLGENRFAFRPQLGVTHRRGNWTAELTGEISFYTENDDFFNGNKLEQDPLLFTHAHLIYSFRPGFWIGASGGYNYGGENILNGVANDDTRQNIAWAVNIAYPINRFSGIKLGYINTHTKQSTGFDSEIFNVGISIVW